MPTSIDGGTTLTARGDLEMIELIEARDWQCRVAAVAICLIAATLMTATPPSPAWAANGDCGQPSSTGAAPKASDALFILKTAVSSETCDLCVCDVTNDGKITASDALKTLKVAVGQNATLACPACTPHLSGKLLVPGKYGMSGQQPAAAPAGSSGSGFRGLVPTNGVTVELVALDADGNPEAPVLGSTVTGLDGSFSFTPAPTPGSQLIVRANLPGRDLRAFVTGNAVVLDPGSETIVAAAIEAVSADNNSTLAQLTLAEIDALSALVRKSDVDFSQISTTGDAVLAIDTATGGVYAEMTADFATGSGAAPAPAGNFHTVAFGGRLSFAFSPAQGQTPSQNVRAVEVLATSDPISIAGNGSVTQPTSTGRDHVLTETSGSVPQQSGPDLAINASAALVTEDINDTPGDPSAIVLSANHGSLLLVPNTPASEGNEVAGGALADGSAFAVIPSLSIAPGQSEGGSDADFALRKSEGLTNASLSGTWSVVVLRFAVEATTDATNVHRAVTGRSSSNTITFDGAGHLSMGGETGVEISLSKDGALPAAPPAAPFVVLSESQIDKPAQNNLDYTLAADGTLTLKSGSDVLALGAVTPDRNVLVLRGDDASGDSGKSSILVGLKRGSGLSNSTGHGTYRSVQFGLHLEANFQPGTPDVSPDVSYRAVAVTHSLGTLDLDGAGTASVHRGVGRRLVLSETSSVQKSNSNADVVSDADVNLSTNTDLDSSGTETHTYSVASNGVVTIDAADNGGMQGYISPDGRVFLLPNVGSDSSDQKEIGMLITLREPQ
ncbi:MAG TPA: hypothetical protein VGK20_04990 [Candidatus Binatia bacterium]